MIIILDMEKPESCEKCRFCEYEQGHCTAFREDEQRRINDMSECPLVDIKKGQERLIDANALKAEVFRACMDKYFMPVKYLDCDTITGIIDKAQTIIEADKEEKNNE